MSFRIPIVIWKSGLPAQKFLRFFQKHFQSRKKLASLKFTLNKNTLQGAETMNLQKAKIYRDGSHYVAIPQGAYPSGKGCKRRVVKPTEQLTLTNESPPETPKERFEKAYKESQSLPKRERKVHIKESLAADFPNKDELNAFIAKHTERMKTNAIKRKVRLMRKLGLQRWDYFVTVTYFYGHSAYMTLRFIAFRTTFVAQ